MRLSVIGVRLLGFRHFAVRPSDVRHRNTHPCPPLMGVYSLSDIVKPVRCPSPTCAYLAFIDMCLLTRHPSLTCVYVSAIDLFTRSGCSNLRRQRNPLFTARLLGVHHFFASLEVVVPGTRYAPDTRLSLSVPSGGMANSRWQETLL